ncbi:toxic anion resistance protein [Peptoniphilus sp. oral taxon 386]|uniref:toxic anion resistance protein n=1 Tax=Peptoniphilus sp. oral taxon 386 TaxID=652713 RepID=UPI0001DAA165|nr:toxic anion resistance protein [Peptoniphilus sp. oral taxon 386]EFI41694.1 toxic anion resistance protein TelA [Peptoniphilus sp. oral taxon 386 str. F0131]
MKNNENKIELVLDYENVEEETSKEIEKLSELEDKKELILSEEEERQIDEFAQKIDITNSNLVLQYGAGAQSKIASFSEKTLDKVKTKDLEEVGDLLTGVVTELKNFDVDEESKGLTAFFKKTVNKTAALKTKYSKVETNVELIKKALEDHQLQLLKDIATLDQMYDLNRDYFKELSMYVEAGKKKLSMARNIELPKLEENAKVSNLPVDAQRVNDYENMISRFEKKIHDLELTKMISLQMAPQIRMVQSSNTVMVEKIQSTIVNTIPLWKSQMVLGLGAAHSMQAAKTQKEVTDFTNDLFRKNAEKLKMSTIETARASERGIVDIDTIKNTNEKLIEALTEVRRIQIEGRKKRDLASIELAAIEENLKNSLMNIAKEN